MSDEYDTEVCGCEECQACLRREVRSLEKALQVMSDARAPVAEDRDAAMSLLRLWVVDHRYAKGCKSNGGLACYGCRTVEWLEAHSDYRNVSPPDDGSIRIALAAPSSETGTAAVPTCKLDVDECAEENGGCPCGAHDDAPSEVAGPAPEPLPGHRCTCVCATTVDLHRNCTFHPPTGNGGEL